MRADENPKIQDLQSTSVTLTYTFAWHVINGYMPFLVIKK